MSLMYNGKSVEPGMDPWGTPALTGYYCWWADCVGVQKLLFMASWNRIFCVAGFTQGWGMQGKS